MLETVKLFYISSFFLLLPCTTVKSEQTNCSLAPKYKNNTFPDYFKFGVATAAYQVEGGWQDGGRGPSIWDNFTHQHPELIADHTNGDVAADSYHKFDLDLAALIELKVNFYRFSISWSRILPNGDLSSKNQEGIDYYNMMINKLVANGIEPVVTMFHYDLPQTFNLFGGFTNLALIKYFSNYSSLLFKTFGDRVKMWITFNEPFDYCVPGYGRGSFPPLGDAHGVADYICMDTTLKAHAEVYRLYRQNFYPTQLGKVGITMSSRFYYSKTNDAAVIDRAMQYSLGWLGYPIYGGTGNYPQVMIDDIGNSSIQEGRPWSRLPSLTVDEREIINHSADFLGLNYYTSRYVEDASPPLGPIPSVQRDSRLAYQVEQNWVKSSINWLYCVPEGLEDILNWIKTNYNNIEVVITENGWGDKGQLNDTVRIDYLKAHLQAVLNAINSGCNVTHYTHWSLIDNFEWRQGYSVKFGLYYVNFTSEAKARIPKQSSVYYKSVIANRTL